MNIEKLREELINDEGIVLEIYLDSLGYRTVGVGHLITENEIVLSHMEVGDSITSQTAYELFANDIEYVLEDCVKLFSDFYAFPEEVQKIVANMMFNLGYTRLNKFNKFKIAVNHCDWLTAADEMVDSRWYNQVTKRANRLVSRMREV